MTDLTRLESANNDPSVGGVLFAFPSGLQKTASWRSSMPILDQREFAQKLVAELLDALMKAGKESDIRETNWVSCVAGVQKHVADWNQAHARRVSAQVSGRFQ